MVKVIELPREGAVEVYKIVQFEEGTSPEHLGTLRVYRDQYLWTRDIFATRKIGRKTAINYFINREVD